ncbi:predicted protein, partial [Nematostella vectensis]
MRVLNVAEKNDAAKELSRIMSRGQCTRREGQSRFNKIYEFNFNILNANARMVMTSVSGHLMSLEFAIAYRKWSSCSPLSLFDAPVVKNVGEDYLPIKKTLECEVRGSQALIIWTDCDREGENIGHEIIDVCTKVCPRIKVYRARFSEITPQSVQRACANLVAPDRLQSEAVDVRMELDLRIGAAFTRFQTLRLQKVFPGFLSDQLISYGSCQFPTLGFVVERYKQVQQFVPEQFFKIKVSHETPDGQVDFVWKRGRLFHRLPCLILYQMCLESPTAKVLSTSSRPKSKWRPLPLDTVELEKLASRKLHINAKETMKIAEKLYTQGRYSVTGTETTTFNAVESMISYIEFVTGFASDVLANGPNPRQGSKTDNAHPPIHPTQYTNNLQGNDKRLYEFIVRHFLACCSQDAQGRETSVEIDIAGEKFTATGLMITARNYLDVYPYDRWSTKVIPVYETNEEFQPTSIEMVDGETTPPPLLTEADLIALMEKHGIGTDATHADHIETIKSRSYVGVQGDGTFLPGQLGMGLVEGYDLMHFEFSKPKLRSGLEADLKRICDGTKSGAVVLREQIAKYKENFIQAAQEAIKLDQALSNYFGDPADFIEQELDPLAADPIVRPCPRCEQHQMTLRKTKEGRQVKLSFYMIGCQGFPQCRASIFLPKSVLALTVDESVCPVCRPRDVHMLRFTFKRGSVPPMTPLQYVGCIGGCDEMLTETLDIKDISRNTRGSQPSRGQSRGRSQSSQFGASQTSASGRGRGRGTRTTGSNQSSRYYVCYSDENAIVCTCGNAAIQLTVRKDGPNQGRQFYKCSQREGGCDFFLWADANGPLPSTPRPTLWSSTNGSSSWNDSGKRLDHVIGDELVCNCRQPAVSRTVNKDGPNKGRPFYSCSKPIGQSCGFFKWADQDEDGTGRGMSRGGSRGGTGGAARGGAGGGGRKRKRCGN